MRNVLILFLVLITTQTASAAESKHNPYVLAEENKSEYTRYLRTLFDQATPLTVWEMMSVPILKKGTPAFKFRSEIRRQVKENGINFAGEWSLVTVGCGTGCNRYFLVHAKVGKVVDSHLTTTNGNPLFVKDKNILVTAGSEEAPTLEDAKKGVWGGPKAWKWDGKRFSELKL